MKEDIYKIVENGYNNVVKEHNYGKTTSGKELDIFKLFKASVGKGKILELGCGNGTSIGHDLINSGFDYTGLDVSKEQIKSAISGVENGEKYFVIGQMTEYVKQVESCSVDGLVTMFADFHEPRILRVQLYTDVYNLLKPGGYVLLTSHPKAWEGYIDDFMGSKMYYSTFSGDWYKITMRDLGFEMIDEFHRDWSHREGQKEKEIFYLFRKPE